MKEATPYRLGLVRDVRTDAAVDFRLCVRSRFLLGKLGHDLVENREHGRGRVFWAAFTHTCSDHPKNWLAQRQHLTLPKS